MTERLSFHPIADAFPLMDGAEFEALVKDIAAHGQHEPIVLYEGEILDGRNRYRACEAAGVDAWLEPYVGNDPIAFVISLNLKRRHLDESQRAMVAAKLATMKHGGDRRSDQAANLPVEKPTQKQAAEMLNVSDRSVRDAVVIRDHGIPELQKMIERGGISVSGAADVARMPEEEQRKIVEGGKNQILKAAKEIRSERAGARRAARTEKLVQISNANAPLPKDRKYPVIYADPPWQYDHLVSVSREIENQYPTMSIEDICAMPVGDLTTPDAMLFLWAPPSFLHKGIRVIEAWGFAYLTSMVWDKQKIGMGYYARQQHEHVLLAYRGTAIVPDPYALSTSIVSAPRGEHSEKPAAFYEIIERMYPELPKVELFARSKRDGWATWGNQSEAA